MNRADILEQIRAMARDSLLVDKGYDVTVSHIRKTWYIAESHIKSDRVDPKALARE